MILEKGKERKRKEGVVERSGWEDKAGLMRRVRGNMYRYPECQEMRPTVYARFDGKVKCVRGMLGLVVALIGFIDCKTTKD